MGSRKRVSLLFAGVTALAWATASNALVVLNNGIYEAHIADGTDNSLGSWNAVTAAGHPTGANNNIMFNQTQVNTNFSSLRVYGPTAVTDYTFAGRGGGVDMDPLVTFEGASPFGPAGSAHRTQWTLTAEGLVITQDVIVTGTTFANSAVYHTVEISNIGSQARDIGWRNLYDWAVNDPGFDDGPNNSIETTSSTVVAPTTIEFSHTPQAGEFARVSVDPGVPTYEPLLGLGFDPGFIVALPVTTPEEYAYVSWPNSFSSSFDFIPAGNNVTGDSAGLSWFGRTANSAISLGVDGSVRLTQAVFGVTPDSPPPGVVPEPGLLLLMGLGLLGFARRQLGRA